MDWSRFVFPYRISFTLEVPFDYKTQLAFGILYIEEKYEWLAEILKIEFDDYFILENPYD